MAGDRVVSFESAKALGNMLNVGYFETSAKTGEAVDKAIDSLVKECLLKVRKEEEVGIQLKSQPLKGTGGCVNALR